jgi:hypothetical protein
MGACATIGVSMATDQARRVQTNPLKPSNYTLALEGEHLDYLEYSRGSTARRFSTFFALPGFG